jgi:hypothetical protein
MSSSEEEITVDEITDEASTEVVEAPAEPLEETPEPVPPLEPEPIPEPEPPVETPCAWCGGKRVIANPMDPDAKPVPCEECAS